MSKRGTLLIVVAVIIVAALAVACYVVIDNNNKPAEYTVTYDQNYEGSPASETKTYTDGTKISAPEAPTRTDYVCVGWYADKDLTEKINFPYKVTKSQTLYAKWIVFDVTKFLNTDFIKATPYGQYLAEKSKVTTGAEALVIEGVEILNQYTSNGFTHGVFKEQYEDGGVTHTQYAVYSFVDKEFLFNIPGDDVKSVKSISLTESNHEFVYVKTADGYRVYDLTKPEAGEEKTYCTSINEPEIILYEQVILDNKCYSFDSDGNLGFDFVVNSSHRPQGGSGITFFEIETETDSSGNVKYKCANILNDDFSVKYSYPYPESAVRCVCYYLGDESYVMQYAVEKTSGDYSYSENGKKYALVTKVINADNGSYKLLDMVNPIFAATNMSKKYHFASMFAEDLKNVLSLYQVNADKELVTDGKLLVALNSDGTIYKTFTLSDSSISFAFIFPTLNSDKYIVWSATIEDGSVQPMKALIDAKANVIIKGITTTNCQKYLICDATDNYNIYSTAGEVIGNYEGKTYIDSTNNLLFFTDDSDKLYVFNGKTMKELTDYNGDLVTEDSFYGYKIAENQYKYFTEDGTLICESTANSVREVCLLNGHHIVEIYLGNNSEGKATFKVFILTNEVTA